jgi:MarR family transcriptional regulator, organic hydroperoxide resistance regulator
VADQERGKQGGGKRERGKQRGASDNATLAAEIWRRMLDYSMVHQRHLQTARELGLNPGATKLLLDLEPDDPRSMRVLAAAFACDASNMTWMVDQLEERGLVERRTFRSDRRVKTVALTDLGEKTKAELLRRFYAPPDDLVALPRQALEQLRDALGELEPSG